MDVSGPALPIHSLTEARLYLQVTPCEACGTGPLVVDSQSVRLDAEHRVVTLAVACKACGQPGEVRFDTRQVGPAETVSAALGELQAPRDPQTHQIINPTQEPSRIVDVAGWLTLYSTNAEAARAAAAHARSSEDRAKVRQLQIEAGRCLDEALKFYDLDNDLPPEDAFYRDDSRHRFRDLPQLFARQHLIELRAALPQPSPAAGDEIPHR